MLEKGNDADLEKALAELGNDLAGLRKMLDQNADGFGAERFPQENRVVADLMKKIGDIEGDERALQKETQAAADKQQAEMERRMRGQIDELIKKRGGEGRAPQAAAGRHPVGTRGLAGRGARARARQRPADAAAARRARSRRGEGGGGARGGQPGTRRRAPGRDRRGAPGAAARRPSPSATSAADAVGEARALAQEIADDLAKLQPRASEMMTPQDREAARGAGRAAVRDRQADRRRRGRGGAQAGRDAGDGEGRVASSRARRRACARRARACAARRLQGRGHRRARRRRPAVQAARFDAGSPDGLQPARHRDPVRIPGADESSAPRAWRQELLDAMKEKAPERFRDEVRRYYEELVR